MAAVALTEQQRDLREVVRDFAREQVVPRVRDYDAAEELPSDILAGMRELGLFGGIVPIEYGGLGLDHVTYSMLIEEMAWADHTLGVLMSMPSALVGAGILGYGNEEQKQRWLTPLARGDTFGGAGVTEPQSGTDVAGMETTYRRDGDSFVITGAKTWISNLDIASFFITFATFDRSKRHRGISAFIVPAELRWPQHAAVQE